MIKSSYNFGFLNDIEKTVYVLGFKLSLNRDNSD